MSSIPYSRYLIYPVTWYSFLIVLGASLALFLSCREEKRARLARDTVLDLALWLIPGGIIGARIYYVLFSFEQFQDDLLSVFRIWEGGLAIYGGIIAGLLIMFLFCRHRNVSFLLMCDIIVPGLAVAQAIGRWGNWFNMEAYGLPVTGSFPCFFPLAVQIPADGYTWHLATFFYESAWDFIVFVFLLLSRHTLLNRKKGDVFFFYLFLYASGRLIIEEMRMDYVVEAYLVADRFYVATSVQGNGTVLPSDTIWASCGEDVTLTFIPETGWFVQNLIVDGQSLGTPSDNSYTFVSISENHTLEVIFAVNQYVITSSVEPINAGQITPYGTQVYSYGDSVTYFIHPFPDYRIVRVEVDGEDVGAVDSYTFSFVDEHHTIVAYFETTGIDEVETSPMDIHVVNGELQVESTGHGQILSVEVFDLAGRCIVRHGAAGTMLQLPLPVATGVYVVRVVTTEAIESRKVSVNRW